MDGHEWTNFVRGNKTPLAPGMCFSDEPMIAIYGEFGIRLEDCLYITENGPKFFTPQSPAIDSPFAYDQPKPDASERCTLVTCRSLSLESRSSPS